MAIILEEIYEVALHRYNMKLVAGGRGLRNLVDWVHTVEEMDYVSFLKGRELIVTTGIKEKDEEMLECFSKKSVRSWSKRFGHQCRKVHNKSATQCYYI